ncbi:MHS family MFS transporter [Alicyclobacillus cycloheptanicus]|uniref:MFS family permease n=1 Tax=Alicyclobacillus cycloheptanicus TaxID=1457 RepID=A0ABT9XNE8_9BACL|nr:MFS transporter [Alicyclobacillus cycloheptanicus]MDQ0191569.1 MFS family permease [Alicyclobacillus cycloheptanicus]WDM02430.1 MHS family MFS transporter [Alicyclobacillus cycloheptanicus]
MNGKLLRVLSASVVGSILEWYDYVVYGTASALVFNTLFFPKLGGVIGTLLSLATFAIGFLVRPIGGVIFGALGDKIGRKRVLTLTIVIMGSATTLIGLMPTYRSIGYWAPILLVALRIVQGIGSGSEYAGAVILMAENSKVSNRGFMSSLSYVGVSIGLMISSGIYGLFRTLPNAAFMSWGWRMPFLLSAVVVVFGLIIRLRLEETPVFAEAAEHHRLVRNPVRTAFRTSPKHIILAWMVATQDNSFTYLFQTFLTAYVTTQLHLPESVMLTTLTVMGFVQLIAIPAFGALSDKIGRRPLLIGGALLSALFGFPLFWLLNTRDPLIIGLSVIFASGIFRGAIVAVQASWYCELFDSRIRYTGFAVGREWPSIFGGLVPVFASAVLIWTRGHTWAISLLIVVFSMLTVVAGIIGPENSKLELDQISNSQCRRAGATTDGDVVSV